MKATSANHDVQSASADDRRKTPDRRVASRRKIFRGGITFWPNGDSAQCFVHNISETGAKLEASGPVPASFDLIIDGDTERRPCSVVWRKKNLIGVKFRVPCRVVSSAKNETMRPIGFRHYPEVCKSLAERAAAPDRDLLLEMAVAWTRAIRRLRAKAR
jgi:hypothetical protein